MEGAARHLLDRTSMIARDSQPGRAGSRGRMIGTPLLDRGSHGRDSILGVLAVVVVLIVVGVLLVVVGGSLYLLSLAVVVLVVVVVAVVVVVVMGCGA